MKYRCTARVNVPQPLQADGSASLQQDGMQWVSLERLTYVSCAVVHRWPNLLAISLAVTLLCLAAEVGPSQERSDPSLPAAEDECTGTGNLLAPKAFRAAVRKALPFLVTIESFGGVSPHVGSRRGRMRGISRPGDGPTTGLILSPDGTIMTSTFNFITRPRVITVVLQDGSRHVAQLLGRDDTRKICLLKIDAVNDLPTCRFAPRSELKVGQWAIAVGVGYGDDDPAISAGIISATSRISGKAVQTDANISPANYGGPLLDITGRVIGICVPLHPQSKDVAAGVAWYDSGIGFAVPLDGADSLLAAMKAGQTIGPGQLGVQVKPADDQGAGAVVVKVLENSAAAKAGIKKEDQIVSVDGQQIQDGMHLRTVIGRYVAGDTVKLVIQRGDKQLEMMVTLSPAA